MAMRRLTLGILLCFPALALAPKTEYSRRIWRSDDGLPQNKIQVVTQTPDGYLWIGTSGGLVRFDGVRFVVFDRSNTPALGDDSILALCPARDGSLWIGTEGGGLVQMKAGVLHAFGAAEGLANPFVRAIGEDAAGRLWVGTDRGFYRLDKGRLRRFDGRGSAPILAALVIHQDRQGVLWVGTSLGLFRMQGEDLVPGFDGSQTAGSVTAMLDDGSGGLLLATESGLRRTRDGHFEPLRPHDPASPRALWRDREGNCWVGTIGAGLMRIGQEGTVVFRSPDSLPDNTVLALFEDNAANLWVGTQDGLLRLTKSGVQTITSEDGLADDNVTTVYQDPGGRLWIGTLTGRLYRLEGDRAVPFPSPVPGFRARGIYVDPTGVQWFSSGTQGFMRVDGKHARVFNVLDGMRSNNVRQFLYDRQGTVWIATGSGLTRYDHGSLRTFYLEEGLSYGGVRVLAEDRHGDILVGTDGGLNRIHNGVFVSDAAFVKLGYEKVWAIHEDRSGSLWLGTRGNGLVRIRDGKITRYHASGGLLSNTVYQILDDTSAGKERFWMSSPAGVFAVDRKELDAVADGRPGPLAVVPYGTDSGMLSSQMNGGLQTAGCRTVSNQLWFPSVKGAVHIDPLQLRVGPVMPVLVEAVIADDRALPVTSDVVIPPGRGKLEIDFTSPDLLSPDRVTFRYRLENFDEVWTPSPKGRVAYYTNLPPGHYRFHVVARDGSQPDRTSEAMVPIFWRPFFYETGWFYALLFATAGLLIWAVFFWFARQTRARYALVLAERTRLAREMHDTVIQGCVGVSTLLEAARSMPPEARDRTRPLLERAAAQIRLTVNEAREAVWDLRHSESGQDEPPTDVVETLKSFASQVEASEGIPVRAEVEGTPASLGNTADRNLLLVAREAIRNAVTHAHPANISVSLRYDPKEVRLEVADDGGGFSPGKTRDNGHYGLVGMRERVEQSGGAFSVTSSPGKGTHVLARIPLRKKHV